MNTNARSNVVTDGIVMVLIPLVMSAVISIPDALLYGFVGYGALYTIASTTFISLSDGRPDDIDNYSTEGAIIATILSFVIIGILLASVYFAAVGSTLAIGVLIAMVIGTLLSGIKSAE